MNRFISIKVMIMAFAAMSFHCLTDPLLAQVPSSMAGLPALTETPEQRDARMQWWRDAKFGLFIYWGAPLTSSPGYTFLSGVTSCI